MESVLPLERGSFFVHRGIEQTLLVDCETDDDVEIALDLSASPSSYEQRAELAGTPRNSTRRVTFVHHQSDHDRLKPSLTGSSSEGKESQKEIQRLREQVGVVAQGHIDTVTNKNHAHLFYETVDRFSRGITDILIQNNPCIKDFTLQLSDAVSTNISSGIGHMFSYLPNVLVAWYYHRATSSSKFDPPYPTLALGLPLSLHQKNVKAGNALAQLSGPGVQFDLGSLTELVLGNLEDVSLLVDMWFLRSVLGEHRNQDVHPIPPFELAKQLLLDEWSEENFSHAKRIEAIMPLLVNVESASGYVKYFAA
ncbi:uncharacterized protein ARMOST_06026 [Armillaria ostoyae]|uniref:Uncharacterized protein n=1 Tax=Armillaria ostoyae TaxID=47428 RepID=A0A284R1X3_ARMOS|nr:uncharacterized protein ARMOST_06026 [Armillaria ostoyae]